MSSFLKVLFQFFLGWTRSLSVQIWNEINHPNGDHLLSWIASNWILLAAVLCAAGLIIDLVVYLFRWQPYRVWRRFFSTLSLNRQRRKTDLNKQSADRTDEEETSQGTGRYSADVNPKQASMRPKRRRLRVTGLFTEEEEIPYSAPQEIIDARKAYHKPVYPRNWKGENRNTDENG